MQKYLIFDLSRHIIKIIKISVFDNIRHLPAPLPNVKTFKRITKDMEAHEFNELLKLMKTNSEAKLKLSLYCLSRIKSRLKAKWTAGPDHEDIAHAILLKMYEKPPLFVFAPYKFICRVTDNYMINLIKRRNRETALSDIPFESKEIINTPYEANDTQLYDKDVILKYINEQDVEIVTLYAVEGFSHKEIAEKLNLSYEAVRARYSRAIRKLKEKLKNGHNTES